MAKSAYHNLVGVIKDLERACSDGDYSIARAFIDLIEDVRDALLDDAEDPAESGADAGLGLPDQQSLAGLGGPAPGHGTGSSEALDQLTRLRDQVERLTALQAVGGLVPSDTAAVAATLVGRRVVKPGKRETS